MKCKITVARTKYSANEYTIKVFKLPIEEGNRPFYLFNGSHEALVKRFPEVVEEFGIISDFDNIHFRREFVNLCSDCIYRELSPIGNHTCMKTEARATSEKVCDSFNFQGEAHFIARKVYSDEFWEPFCKE